MYSVTYFENINNCKIARSNMIIQFNIHKSKYNKNLCLLNDLPETIIYTDGSAYVPKDGRYKSRTEFLYNVRWTFNVLSYIWKKKKRFENHMKCLLIKDNKDYIQTMNFYIYGGK